MGLLDGKVVLITGAGGGIGRAHALAMAAEGARIVVNDLGGSRDGVGGDDAMASAVVREIENAGGEAVANFDSVTDAEGCQRMVAAAIDTWGRLDVVVNNAGILRDKTFAKMTDAEWFPVLDVHLNGTRNVCVAALDALKESEGAIINTTSYSGMIGNFGQSNYGAAKAGIYGFSRVLSLELRKYGISVNCVAPVAKTRMTEDIAMVEDDWGPEYISPIVLFLASDAGSSVTGRVFGVQGPRIHLYEVKVNDGVEKEDGSVWTVAEIDEALDDIMAWEQPASGEAEGDDLTHAFSFFPIGFKADAAGSWSAVIHWKVGGGADQTLVIDKGVCTHEAGLSGSPTCTITVDRETLLGMMTGEVDPTKAFMSGKASADNMGDLMKLATVFDFAKAAAAYAEAASGPSDVVSDVFAHFPAGFKAERAGDWKATIHWAVDGGTSQTLRIADGTCTVDHELTGNPTCTIKVTRDVLVAMFTGELDAQQAFMSGKATADNMGDLMKLATAFDFAAVAAAYKAEPGESASGDAPAEPAPVAELPIGKRYDGGYHLVTADQATAYAEATNDANAHYTGEDAIAPPMYHVRAFHPLLMKMATDPALGLDLLRLVHGEHDMQFHKPLRHGDVVHVRGELASVEDKSSGRLASYRLFGFVDGELAIEGTTGFFVRAAKRGEKKAAGASDSAPGEPDLVVEQHVDSDQASRYAVASGDDNPIHTSDETAKSAGLPGVILHGLCTMALAQRDLVDRLADGDPTRLKRLGVRFAKPVFPGETLTLQAWTDGEDVRFETRNSSGATVISNGVARIVD